MNNSTSDKAIARGLVGGFMATIAMDLVCAGFFASMGMPADLTYSFIGNVAGSLFSRIGMDLSGSRPLGAVVHFLLGIALGGLLGLAVSRIKALQADSLGKNLLLGIAYTEIVSQPIVATAPLLGNMTSSEILHWYALSTGMHLIYGTILGGILSCRQRAVTSTDYAA